MTILLVGLVMALGGILIGVLALVREQSRSIDYLRRELGLKNDECKALMESVAKGARTSIQFSRDPKKPLEQLETYYEQRPQLEKITAG